MTIAKKFATLDFMKIFAKVFTLLPGIANFRDSHVSRNRITSICKPGKSRGRMNSILQFDELVIGLDVKANSRMRG